MHSQNGENNCSPTRLLHGNMAYGNFSFVNIPRTMKTIIDFASGVILVFSSSSSFSNSSNWKDDYWSHPNWWNQWVSHCAYHTQVLPAHTFHPTAALPNRDKLGIQQLGRLKQLLIYFRGKTCVCFKSIQIKEAKYSPTLELHHMPCLKSGLACRLLHR